MEEAWFTLDSIEETADETPLYCISVDSPERQFLAGKLGVPTHNSEAGKEEDALKGEASMIVGSIARLGRAAGVHLIIATQRPDAGIIPGETKANLGVRVNCGRTDSNASSMILGTADGTRVKANPRGRLYLRIYGAGDHGQGFFAPQSWVDEWLAAKGLNPDGTPLSTRRSRLANVTDMAQFEGADLDAREGVDNHSAIERIREEEASGDFEAFMGSSEDEEDWGFEEEDEGDDFEEGEEEAPPVPTDRPLLGQKKDDGDKWHRPEDDWDADLEALIEENNS